MYDIMYVIFKFLGGKVINWDGKSWNVNLIYGGGWGIVIYGMEGFVFVDWGYYKYYDRDGKLVMEKVFGGDEVGIVLGGGGSLIDWYVCNFFEVICGKVKFVCLIDEGVISINFCYYVNIFLREGDVAFVIDL